MVTTPERLRRRQRIEGAFLMLIGILLVVSTLWFRHQDQVQRGCLAQVVQGQNDVLARRGQLAAEDAAINTDESAATRSLIVKVFASKTSAEAHAAFDEAQKQWATIDQRREEVRKIRAANPIPDLPAGTCE